MCEQHFFHLIMPLFSFLVLFTAALGYLVFANTLFPACFNQLGKQDGSVRSHCNKLAVIMSVLKGSHRSHNSGSYLEAALLTVKGEGFDQLSRGERKYKGNFLYASHGANMPECNF